MKLWLISQSANKNYDTFDSAVVAAESEEVARKTHPGGYDIGKEYGKGTWVEDPNLIMVKYLGEADTLIEAGVICASFNAG